jgi:HK97 family phage major capsid protein
MNLKQQRAAALKAAQTIIDTVKASNRDLTREETSTVEAKFAEVDELDRQIKAAEKSAETLRKIGALPASGEGTHLFSESDAQGFVNAARSKTSFSTTVRYKAHEEGGILPGVGTAVVTNPDPKSVFALRDLFTPAPATGPTVRYYTLAEAAAVEPATEAVSVVGEGTLKPEADVDYAPVDATLVKLATRYSLTDELGEDAPFLVQEIQQSVLRAVLVRENKLCIDTIDATSGILTGTSADDDLIDLLAAEIGASEAINGQTPSAVVLNPVDLATVRTAKANT